MRFAWILFFLMWVTACHHPIDNLKKHPITLRIATFNASLSENEPNKLIERLKNHDKNAKKIAAIIQHVRPDVLLINEFDYDEQAQAATLFETHYLEVSQFEQTPITYPYRYLGTVNTGTPSGLDLDQDGTLNGPADAWGFGHHEGQYGMLVLSRFPIDTALVRSFQKFRWAKMPNALQPVLASTRKPFYDAKTWPVLRLSSKNHWDIPIKSPNGIFHFLVHHPTPPVFDGPEDRNGTRNHDEIRLWADYINPNKSNYLVDDQGQHGGLLAGEKFVIAGDHNADPLDGDSAQSAILQLLEHPMINATKPPASKGATEAAQREGGVNLTQRGPAATDTGSFGKYVGNLRIDYVLPEKNMVIQSSGVFWPEHKALGHDWIDASDHRLMWVDLIWP